MGYYYPQAAMTMRILWEDGKLKSDPTFQKVYPLQVQAKSVTVTINDYATADTFECEIDYKNFPFDPRTIRACGVTIHMENRGELFKLSDNGIDAIKPSSANTVFLGFADEDSITFDDTKRTVKLEGRDLTALLIDKPYAEGSIAMTNRVDILIQKVINDLKETQPISVVVRGIKPETLPVLATFDQSHHLSGHKNVDRHENYWEVVQDLAARSGLIAFIEIDKLILTEPRNLYDASNAKVFIYGSNVKNLTYKRKIGRKKHFNVIVRSLIVDQKLVVDAKIPAEATKEWSKATGIDIGEVKLPELGPNGEAVDKAKWKAAPYQSFRVSNCKNKEHLIKVAQNIYEEIGRQQIEGSFETKEMTVGSVNDPKGSFDVLKIRNGSPIQIRMEQGDLAGLMKVIVWGNKSREQTPEEKVLTVQRRTTYLLRKGYAQSIAEAFAKTLDLFPDVYYTKQVRFSLDNESGFKAQIEFINFVDLKRGGAG